MSRSVQYRPGTWAAMAGARAVLLVDLPAAMVTGTLWQAVETGGVAEVLDALLSGGVAALPPFGLLADDGSRTRVVVRGSLAATVGDEVVEAGDLIWAERLVESGVEVTFDADHRNRPPVAFEPLAGGSVRAGAVVVAPAAGPLDVPAPDPYGVAPEIAAVPAPDPYGVPAETTTAAPDPFGVPVVAAPHLGVETTQVTAVDAPTAPARPAEVVRAVACPEGHLNPPAAGVCRLCGQLIPPQEAVAVPRPPLGVLRLSTGQVVPLDNDMVVGRQPTDASQAGATLVPLGVGSADVSRSHVRVSVDGWQVTVTDVGSVNGTWVTRPGRDLHRLRAGEPEPIEPETVVTLAQGIGFIFGSAG